MIKKQEEHPLLPEC